ncbi:GAF domain-containing protein [Duganella sp. P38]|uniref:GAF domain-containing protein n=1 Tax=Duganella sp. P38 TaxID=3423949 RepID=UPI003D78E7E2
MLAAPIPPYDKERVAALRQMLILDTPPEERFDKVVQFAAQEFDVPIALISLLDENRQWFKASVGVDICETGRDISFCGHVILQPDLFVINDARSDERFADNPLVTTPPHVIFYAGAPLRIPSGFVIGTLCIIDHEPRTLDATEMAIFTSLRDLLLEELSNRPEALHA